MTTNVEPPRAGVVGGGAAAGTAAGAAPGITTTPGVSKKEPVGERGRESHVRTGNECAIGKSWRHARRPPAFHMRTPRESCEFASASKFGWASWDRMALTWDRPPGNISMGEFASPLSLLWLGQERAQGNGASKPTLLLNFSGNAYTEETAYRLSASTQAGNYFL